MHRISYLKIPHVGIDFFQFWRYNSEFCSINMGEIEDSFGISHLMSIVFSNYKSLLFWTFLQNYLLIMNMLCENIPTSWTFKYKYTLFRKCNILYKLQMISNRKLSPCPSPPMSFLIKKAYTKFCKMILILSLCYFSYSKLYIAE